MLSATVKKNEIRKEKMKMNEQEYLNGIPESIRPRLLRAINALLSAGRDTVNVAETLSPQASFGKFEGCHKEAIRVIANGVCARTNAEIQRAALPLLREINESMKRNFPELSNVARINLRRGR